MTKTSPRVQRVADQIQRELAALISRRLDDPRINMVSITEVELSSDLAHAKVYVTVMAEEDGVQRSLQALNRASAYLRRLLAGRLTVRTVPSLQFRYDASLSRGEHLSNLIDRALAADRRNEARE